MTEEDRVVNGGFLLVNPNNTGEDIPPPSPVRMKQADSKERLFFKSKSSSSTRTKSPSFFKMLVGRGLRKVSNNETEDSDKKGGDTGFFSDNDEPISFSAIPDSQRKRINHIATLPRRNSKSNGHKPLPSRISHDDFQSSLSPEESISRTSDVFEDRSNKGDDFTDCDDQGESLSYQGGGSMVQQTTPSTGQTEYTSVGLEALEMLHNQLQILVIQDGDSDMADIMHENVEDSLRKQVKDLQDSLTELQSTEQNLRLSLKIAEMRAHEAETKLHHSSQRGLKMEENYLRLEKEYNTLYHHYNTLEKHLQKQAVLQQMQQLSPSRKGEKRPNSANNTRHRHHKSFDSSYSSQSYPVKRHNSSEFLCHRQKTSKKMSDCSLATADINPCSTLPTRLHSGSLSHTETRV